MVTSVICEVAQISADKDFVTWLKNYTFLLLTGLLAVATVRLYQCPSRRSRTDTKNKFSVT